MLRAVVEEYTQTVREFERVKAASAQLMVEVRTSSFANLEITYSPLTSDRILRSVHTQGIAGIGAAAALIIFMHMRQKAAGTDRRRDGDSAAYIPELAMSRTAPRYPFLPCQAQRPECKLHLRNSASRSAYFPAPRSLVAPQLHRQPRSGGTPRCALPICLSVD